MKKYQDVREYCLLFKEPYRTQLLENCTRPKLDEPKEFKAVLSGLFSWSQSAQGHLYWSLINDNLYRHGLKSEYIVQPEENPYASMVL